MENRRNQLDTILQGPAGMAQFGATGPGTTGENLPPRAATTGSSDPHAADEDVFENSKQPKPEHGGRFVHLRRNAVGALVAVVALAGAGYAGADYFAGKKKQSYETQESDWIEQHRNAPIPEAASVIVLNEGVAYRDTPYSIDDSSWHGIPKRDGNIAGRVANNAEIPTSEAIWKVDKNGTWLGFTFDRLQELPAEPKFKSSQAIAEKYVWVNYGQLRGKNNAKGEPWVTAYPVFNARAGVTTVSGTMDAAGNMIDKATGLQSAYAVQARAGQTAAFLEMFKVPVSVDTSDTTAPTDNKK